MYETEFTPQHRFSTGLSMNWDKFNQTTNSSSLPASLFKLQEETTTGAYAQYTFNMDEKFVALGGIRADYSTLHKKTFITPRLHLKYAPVEWFNWRASAGKGYRTVFVMPENSFYLASNRQIEVKEDLKQESAWNYGTSVSFHIPIKSEELKLSAEWYYTDFENQVVTDVDSDAHKVSFYNLKGDSYANSVQFEASYPLFKGFNLLAAYRFIDARTTYNGNLMRKPLTSKYKALVTTSYATNFDKWVFDLTAQFNGGGRMPTPDGSNPEWEPTFKPYTVLNAQITKNFRTWSIYAGSENLTSFTQKNPIIEANNPSATSNFDATMVWGPTQKRKLYFGVRYKIGK